MKRGILIYKGSFRDRDERLITVKIKKVGYYLNALVSHLDVGSDGGSWGIDELIETNDDIVIEFTNSAMSYDGGRVYCDRNKFTTDIDMKMIINSVNEPALKTEITVCQRECRHNLYITANELTFDGNGSWKSVSCWSETGDPYFSDPTEDWCMFAGGKSWSSGGYYTNELKGFDTFIYCGPNNTGEVRTTTQRAMVDGVPFAECGEELVIRQTPGEGSLDIIGTQSLSSDGYVGEYQRPVMACHLDIEEMLNVRLGGDSTNLQYELIDTGYGTGWVDVFPNHEGFSVQFHLEEEPADKTMILRMKDPDGGIYNEIMIYKKTL